MPVFVWFKIRMFSRIHQRTSDIHTGHILFKFKQHYSLRGLVLTGMVDKSLFDCNSQFFLCRTHRPENIGHAGCIRTFVLEILCQFAYCTYINFRRRSWVVTLNTCTETYRQTGWLRTSGVASDKRFGEEFNTLRILEILQWIKAVSVSRRCQ